jgi:hypothetical protein
LHQYPITDYDVGKDFISDYALSVSSTKEYRYDVCPIDLRKNINE